MLVESGHRRCEKHRVQERKEIDQRRGSAARRGYDTKWRAARNQFLAIHPLCVECRRQGRVRAATVVDHIVPHKGDMSLFWDIDNWEAICKKCHDSKTAAADGRWGGGSKSLD
jgi:5-methylcytosine-specific restriction enzyme A